MSITGIWKCIVIGTNDSARGIICVSYSETKSTPAHFYTTIFSCLFKPQMWYKIQIPDPKVTPVSVQWEFARLAHMPKKVSSLEVYFMIMRPIECERLSFSHWPCLLGPFTMMMSLFLAQGWLYKNHPVGSKTHDAILFLNDDQWGSRGILWVCTSFIQLVICPWAELSFWKLFLKLNIEELFKPRFGLGNLFLILRFANAWNNQPNAAPEVHKLNFFLKR